MCKLTSRLPQILTTQLIATLPISRTGCHRDDLRARHLSRPSHVGDQLGNQLQQASRARPNYPAYHWRYRGPFGPLGGLSPIHFHSTVLERPSTNGCVPWGAGCSIGLLPRRQCRSRYTSNEFSIEKYVIGRQTWFLLCAFQSRSSSAQHVPMLVSLVNPSNELVGKVE